MRACVRTLSSSPCSCSCGGEGGGGEGKQHPAFLCQAAYLSQCYLITFLDTLMGISLNVLSRLKPRMPGPLDTVSRSNPLWGSHNRDDNTHTEG